MAHDTHKKYTVDEFYSMDLPERCELINGDIVDMSPSPNQRHQTLLGGIFAEIRSYIKKNGGKCIPFITSDVKLNDSTTIVPDIYVTCTPDKLDGQRHVGAPDWVIEIVSPYNISMDYVTKLSLYHAHGVREYWIIDPSSKQVHVYVWDNEESVVKAYSFEEEITAFIYKDNENPLTLRISDLL